MTETIDDEWEVLENAMKENRKEIECTEIE